ncbi:MAG: polymer-forming cytoskeletal protein [Thioalkalispiraceae bacterium]|jgi:hypothetical protein
MIRRYKRLPLFFVLLGLLSVPASAQQTGETVTLRGIIKDDVYAAGKRLDIQAEVNGDVVAAGQDVNIDQTINGDVIVAGETVNIRAHVVDDVRAAGRSVVISGNVGDHVVAAGETLRLRANASINGWAWLAGAYIDISGNIGRELKAVGDSISISGEIKGDATLVSEKITLLPGAHIHGQLIYHGTHKPQVHADARIDGGMVQRPVPFGDMAMKETGNGGGWLFAVSLIVACIFYYLLFPYFSLVAARTVETDPWTSIGLGLAFLVTIPFISMLLLASIIGMLVAFVLLACYLVLLLVGLLNGMLYVADRGLRLVSKQKEIGKGLRTVAIIMAFIALGVVQLVPFLGGLVVLLLLLIGLGALNLAGWRVYQAD